jgi:hypothetical protein
VGFDIASPLHWFVTLLFIRQSISRGASTRNLVLIGVFILAEAAGGAHVDDNLDCFDSGSINQSEINACAEQDFEKADAELNRIRPKVK